MANENILTTDEVLLLENLTYLSGFKEGSPLQNVTNYEGKTIDQFLNAMDVSKLDNSTDYGSFMDGKDWKNIIQAVQNNDTLMNMRIADVNIDHADGGGGGVSAVFISDDSGEAVVAFRGTASYEWKDNFVGAGPTNGADGVSTKQQENALDWYRSAYEDLILENYNITLTGHSKGGNKAKYITILDDSVDRCISFDGQGFSDEFLSKYESQIANRQDLIKNHNVDYDYVNLLLNDIGDRTYYKGYDFGAGGFLENHCPNTFFNFSNNGEYSLSLSESGQAAEMLELDKFLNSYLRSQDPEDKAESLELIGNLVEGGFNGEGSEYFLNVLLEPGNESIAAYLLAYLIEYEQANPEFADAIGGILEEFGMEGLAESVDMAEGILNSKYFDIIVGFLDGATGLVPDRLWDKISDWIDKEYGIKLSGEELERLVGTIGIIRNDMNNIEIAKGEGDDLKIPSAGRGRELEVRHQELKKNAKILDNCIKQLNSSLIELEEVRRKISHNMESFRPILQRIHKDIEKEQKACKSMADHLRQIGQMYGDTEKSIVNALNIRICGRKTARPET